MKQGLRPGTKAWQDGMRELRLKQAAVARKARAQSNGASKPHRSKAQIEAMKEKKRTRDRERRAEQRREAGAPTRQTKNVRQTTREKPDHELTAEQLARREYNKRYNAERRAAKLKIPAGVPDSELTPEQLRKREDNRRYRANKKARTRGNGKNGGNGHSEPQEMHFPLEAIPDRVPSSLRERGPSRAPAVTMASIGGFDANKLLILEVAKLFNRLLDTP